MQDEIKASNMGTSFYKINRLRGNIVKVLNQISTSYYSNFPFEENNPSFQ